MDAIGNIINLWKENTLENANTLTKLDKIGNSYKFKDFRNMKKIITWQKGKALTHGKLGHICKREHIRKLKHIGKVGNNNMATNTMENFSHG